MSPRWEFMISCIAELHGRSWADQTEHRYAFRSCSPTRRGRLPVRQGNKDTAGCLHPASVTLSLSLSLSPIVFWGLTVCGGCQCGDYVFCDRLGWSCFPVKVAHVRASQRAFLWHLFLISPSTKGAWKKVLSKGKKKKKSAARLAYTIVLS